MTEQLDTNHTHERTPPPIPEMDAEMPDNTEPEITGNTIADLLKSPKRMMQRLENNENLLQMAAKMLFYGLLFHSIYGFTMALFDSTQVALITAWKAPAIALMALVLCIPSLYIFSCVAGIPVTIRQVLTIACSIVAMTGIMLLGFTPVAWLFSVSTSNLPFVVIMNYTAWCIAVGFSLKLFAALANAKRMNGTAGLKCWLLVYVIVSLQMATTLRPLLGKCEHGWRETEKKFFLAHFIDTFDDKPAPTGPAEQRK